jgi:hypothetical protein
MSFLENHGFHHDAIHSWDFLRCLRLKSFLARSAVRNCILSLAHEMGMEAFRSGIWPVFTAKYLDIVSDGQEV